jgi:hypothetical protein
MRFRLSCTPVGSATPPIDFDSLAATNSPSHSSAPLRCILEPQSNICAPPSPDDLEIGSLFSEPRSAGSSPGSSEALLELEDVLDRVLVVGRPRLRSLGRLHDDELAGVALSASSRSRTSICLRASRRADPSGSAARRPRCRTTRSRQRVDSLRDAGEVEVLERGLDLVVEQSALLEVRDDGLVRGREVCA